MKSVAILLLIGAIVLAVPAGANAQPKKYEIKSGIVTFENVTTIGKIKMVEKMILYFDDYGYKECKEVYTKDKLTGISLSDGKTRWNIDPVKKTAMNLGAAVRGTEMKFDWNEVSEKEKKNGNAKLRPNIVIAGKTCQSFQTTPSGSTVFAGWKNICLLTDVDNYGVHAVIKAVKVEENVKVPPEKFTVPAGYTIQ